MGKYMSKCYSCQTIGEHQTWCIGYVPEKPMIEIPRVPEEAMVPCLFLPEEEEFIVKDSGKRQQFDSGMVRDVQDNKVDISRVFDGPMLYRWADHITKGAVKYPDIKPGVPNWTLAAGEAELVRFKKSAARHFYQWINGDNDEDHAAAVMFNLNGYEFVLEKLKNAKISN